MYGYGEETGVLGIDKVMGEVGNDLPRKDI